MSAATPKNQSKGQLAYEQERAKKAGKSLEEWRRAKVKAKQDTEKKPRPSLPKNQACWAGCWSARTSRYN